MAGHRDYFGCPHCQKYHARGHAQKEQKALPPAPKMDYSTRVSMQDYIFGDEVSFPVVAPVYFHHTYPDGQRISFSEENPEFIANTSFNVGVASCALEIAKWKQLYQNALVEKPPDSQTELIVSYRVWRYDNGNLRSAYKDTLWPQFKPMSKDIYQDMGIHGVKDYKKIPELMDAYGGGPQKVSMVNPAGEDYPENTMVAGAINMWGSVREHEIGYLSEFAYPKELYVGPDVDILKIMTLEENYGVPVVVREELARTAWKRSIADWVFSTTPPFTVTVPPSSLSYYNTAAVQAMLYGTGMWKTKAKP